MTELRNRRATFDYEILETFEAGLVLTGSEVKSLREGGASIAESYGRIRGGEVFIDGMNIPVYRQASYNNHEPLRTRKLLLNRSEIKELKAGIEQRGLTMVPLKLYFKDGYAKLQLGLARGRKRHDKRQKEAEKDAKRQMEQSRKGSLYTLLAGMLLALSLSLPVSAQDLLVEGQNLGKYRTDLVPGVTYGQAGSLAAAFGAGLDIGDTAVSLSLGGRTVVLPHSAPGAQLVLSGDAVSADGQLWLPVKAVSQAFGAHVTLLSGGSSDVLVSLPTGNVTAMTAAPGQLQLDISTPVPWSAHYNEPLDTLVISLDRTGLRTDPGEVQAAGIRRAWLVRGGGSVELRLQLEPDSNWQVSAAPAGIGFQLQVTVAGMAQPAPSAAGGQVQLTASAGEDSRAAMVLADSLQAAGIQASVQPVGVAIQPGAAVALQLLVDPVAAAAAVYYLGDLLDPVHEGAFSRLSGTPDIAAARRTALLTPVVPDGESLARQLALGLNSGQAVSLPLPQLLGGRGRAVLLVLPATTATGLLGTVHDVLVQFVQGTP